MNFFKHSSGAIDYSCLKKPLIVSSITFVLFFFLCFQVLAAESHTKAAANSNFADLRISGKVVDENDLPLIGAVVKIKGVNQGASTDINGAFTINAAENAVLVVSYIGYISQEVSVNGRTSLTIKLAPSSSKLDEVVVVGYGTQTRANVTGAIASTSSATITRAATTDATGALQGNVPGAVVVKNPGKPGSGYSINIRGLNSFGGTNSPLFVIDGIPTTGGINDLNPADIEKIDILKDASSTAIYGSRGAKGVVIVTTKRGKAGKTEISYDGYMGLRTPTHLPEMFNAEEYIAYMTERRKGLLVANPSSTPIALVTNPNNNNTDWASLILQNGTQMNHNISASGGDEKTLFSLGAGFLREEGNVSPEDFKRYSFKGSIDRQISEKWKAGMSFYMGQNLRNVGSDETLRTAYRHTPLVIPYDSNGQLIFRSMGSSDFVTNPFFDQINDVRLINSLRGFGNLYLQVSPLPNLTLKSTFSPSVAYSRNGRTLERFSKEGLGSGDYDRASIDNSQQFIWLWDNQATYDREFGSHKVTGTLIQSLQKDKTEGSNLSAYNLPYNSSFYNLGTGTNTDYNGTFRGPAVGSSFRQFTLASGRARFNYSYKDKYIFAALGTLDGSSRLAEGNQWKFFPSVSAKWRMAEEDFIKNKPAINELSLRLSYGFSGNDRVDPYSTQATLASSPYYFGNSLAVGYTPNQLANKDLTWETTEEVNLGLDFGILNNRIGGTIDVYNRVIHDILANRNLPAPAGFNLVTANVGKLRNRGIEIGLNTLNVRTGKFSWRSDIVFDANKNEILETTNGKKDDVGSNLFIGQPVQVNFDYVFDGIWQTNEATLAAVYNQKPGQVRVKDINNDKVINASDRQIIGKRVPDWSGSLGNTFRYGNLDLYVMLYTRQGEQYLSGFDQAFMGYNTQYNQAKVNYWTAENPSQTNFQPGNAGPYTAAIQYRKTDFVRINNITLGYNLPKSLLQNIKVNNLRVYATANNPFIFTDYNGFDPEWNSQNTYGTAISSATYMFGVNLSF